MLWCAVYADLVHDEAHCAWTTLLPMSKAKVQAVQYPVLPRLLRPEPEPGVWVRAPWKGVPPARSDCREQRHDLGLFFHRWVFAASAVCSYAGFSINRADCQVCSEHAQVLFV